MPMKGRTTCAVHGCSKPVSGPANLCDEHRLPGGIVKVDGNTMVITTWYAEHGHESGIMLLNDFALGDLFGGREGFEANLTQQGFTNVRNLGTLLELEIAKQPPPGPWQTAYPWEMN